MPQTGRGKWQGLLTDSDVRRWYDNLARGSEATADNYLRTLGRFLHWCNLRPLEYSRLEAKKRGDLLADFITEQLGAGKAPSYVGVTKKVVVSWLDWNHQKLGRRIKVEGTTKRPALEETHIPTAPELKQVLNVADARARTAIALMAFSGLRPQVLGSYRGDAGLRVKDFPEARIRKVARGGARDSEEGGRALTLLAFEKAPTRIVVPEHLSKIGKPYFSFLGEEGAEYLTAYMRERVESGEELSADSPIITPKWVRKPFIRTLNIGDLIRRPMRMAGLQEPPYIWRSYFSSRAMLAEAKGLLKDWKEFFMGHKGGIAEVYSLGKQLPPDTIEVMREAYGKALEYLETTPRVPKEDPMQRWLHLTLKWRGYSDEEISALDLEGMEDEEILELLEKAPRGFLAPNGSRLRQRIIETKQLPEVLHEGWLFKATLPDGRIIVEIEGPG